MTQYPANYPSVTHVMEVTDFKDEKTAIAALETLLWLEQGAPHKFDGLPGKYIFDMDEFIRPSSYNNNCGTACCIAGAIELFRKKGRKPQERLAYYSLIEKFNITNDCKYETELEKLFFVSPDTNLRYITAKTAAHALFYYLTTGKTEWKLNNNKGE